MSETPTFMALKHAGRLSASPLQDTLAARHPGRRSSWRCSAPGRTSVSLYTSIVYMLYFLENVLKVEQTRASLCLGVAILVAAPMYPVFGRLSDAIGRAKVILVGIALWIVAAYPCFAGIRAAVSAGEWGAVIALISVLAILTAMIMAPLPAFIAESFPPQSRTTGFGLSQQLATSCSADFFP
ncbi:MFS transporter [Burkholderia gladioli]|uniref:MFS transporter n=1 Tax=Burkholderia gladioli TaxID=28095 RepID=UPI001E4FEAED|nr:MFS transporter [Burkholderia gladioli]